MLPSTLSSRVFHKAETLLYINGLWAVEYTRSSYLQIKFLYIFVFQSMFSFTFKVCRREISMKSLNAKNVKCGDFTNFLALLWFGYFSSAGSHSTDVLSQIPPLYLHNIIRPQLLSSYWFMFYYCSSYNYYYHRASFFDLKKKRKHFFRSSEHWEKDKKKQSFL